MKLKQITVGVLLAGTVATGGTIAVDRAIDPYTDKGTHYELPVKSDIPQGERVEIHKNKAQMDLIGWNDEYKISIIPQIPSATLGAADKPFTVQADRPLLSKKMEYKNGDVTAFIEPKQGTENEFDIDFTLDSKPDTNVFTYKIEGAEDFDFFYQPALTQEEIDNGDTRPENIDGSYAVYHKTNANHRLGDTNYASGKAFHIYRPKVIDANGAEQWAELNYQDGILYVEVPQKFIDSAAFPVVVDPTFGYTTIGASNSSWGTGGTGCSVEVTKFTTSSAIENAYKITAAADSAFYFSGRGFRTAIYSDSGGLPSILVASSSFLTYVTNSTSTTQWTDTTLSVPASLAASTDYWIGGGNNACLSGDATQIRADATGGTSAYREGVGINDPFGTPTSSGTIKLSIYVTYADPATRVDATIWGAHAWYAPPGVTSADVACWGGGGGGHNNATTNGGAGGGGGAFASSTVTITPGNKYTFTIGVGGAAGAADGPGGDGGDSSFIADDKTVSADNGTGATSSTANGTGGTTANSTGDVEFAGGDGGDGLTTDDTGGGGGASAGPHGAGGGGANGQAATGGGGGGANGGATATTQTGGTSTNGGAGAVGASGSVNGAVGNSHPYGGGGGGGGDNGFGGGFGGFPGGGGGGSEGTPSGGGRGGQCIITYLTPSAGGGSNPTPTTPKVLINFRTFINSLLLLK